MQTTIKSAKRLGLCYPEKKESREILSVTRIPFFINFLNLSGTLVSKKGQVNSGAIAKMQGNSKKEGCKRDKANMPPVGHL
ncbi:hypothetical protein [Spongiimicrobium sp. 3-5]|uniref:hypothetical protein n=1 Tax=Spongiimicrobium sp. 3-5 TaxID=3332596 RepID=UPI0039814BBB